MMKVDERGGQVQAAAAEGLFIYVSVNFRMSQTLLHLIPRPVLLGL